MKKEKEISNKGGSECGRPSAGRPTKYTPATVRRICEAVALGVPNKHAAALAGISEETFCKWQREKIQFSESIQRAIAKGIEARLKIITRAA